MEDFTSLRLWAEPPQPLGPQSHILPPAVLSGADGGLHGVDEDRGHAVVVGETDSYLTSRESLSAEPYHKLTYLFIELVRIVDIIASSAGKLMNWDWVWGSDVPSFLAPS
jgi:hypothetical protein